MDENLDGGPRPDRWRQHRTIEEGSSGRHCRPSEKEHGRLPRHAGADSAERLCLGALSATLCHAARSDGSPQAPDPGQTGTEATTDSGENERATAPAAASYTTDLARDRTRGNKLERLSR